MSGDTEPDVELVAGAATKLADAVQALIYPQPVWALNRVLNVDARYVRMQQALTATSIRSGATTTKSKPPARIDVIDWLVSVDTVTRGWGGEPSTMERLKAVAETKWAPEQLDTVREYAAHASRWVDTAKELLGDNNPTVALRGCSCPRCDASYTYKWAAGERVRIPPLWVGEHGAQCVACRTKWVTDTEQAAFRRMLGIETAC